MGSNTSKQNNEVLSPQKNVHNISGGKSDPRSPTPEIIRTPLQDKSETKRNITKNANLTKSFDDIKGEDKLIRDNPILSAVIKNHLQSYDPRSPTQDFERTPIIIASKINEVADDKKSLRIKNDYSGSPILKNTDIHNYDSCAEAKESPEIVPKNLCNGFHDISLNNTLKHIDEPLGSSTASNEAIENDVSHETDKPIKLLETNFDYVEVENLEDAEEVPSISELDNSEENIKHIPLFKILNNDPRSPTVGIERTPIVVAKINNEEIEDNVEEMSDDTLIKVLQSKNVELRQTMTKDNHEGVLIYEDDSTKLNDTPKKSASSSSSSSSGVRTPLSCMKNKTEGGHARSKSANTIIHEPKDQKARRTSYIPRLKSLSKTNKLNNINSVSLKNIAKSTAIAGDCENTPPHTHRDRWDKDNSIVL